MFAMNVNCRAVYDKIVQKLFGLLQTLPLGYDSESEETTLAIAHTTFLLQLVIQRFNFGPSIVSNNIGTHKDKLETLNQYWKGQFLNSYGKCFTFDPKNDEVYTASAPVVPSISRHVFSGTRFGPLLRLVSWVLLMPSYRHQEPRQIVNFVSASPRFPTHGLP